MIHFLKYLDVPWEQARGYLREDLDHLEAALNARWSQLFSDGNTIKAGAIGGDPTIETRYVANTGPDHAPQWDQINLTNGVKGRLPLTNLVPSSAPSILVGRRSGSAGNVEEITLGTGLTMTGTVLSSSGGGGGGFDPALVATRVSLRM